MDVSARTIRSTRWDLAFRALVLASIVLYVLAVYDNLVHSFISVSSYSLSLHLIALFVLTPSVLVASALIIWRVPGNNVGAFLLLLGLGSLGWQFSYKIGIPDFALLLKILFYLFWFGIAFPSLIYLMLSFPTGKVYPPSWKPWVITFAAVKFIGVALELLTLAPANPLSQLVLGKDASLFFVPVLSPVAPLISATIGSNGLLMFLGVLAGFVSLILRYRASNLRERQQIKWVVWSFAVLTMAAIFVAFVSITGFATDPTSGDLSGTLFFAAILIVILSLTISVLRYHLFDIDLIIRKTLIYALLTGVLLLTYFGSVVILQQIVAAVAGQRQNELVTVLSTLAIAALFIPFRNRIQQVIDKRFCRSKYDAQKVLERFAETARDETDLQKLTGQLIEVVEETMQPVNVRVWLMKEKEKEHR